MLFLWGPPSVGSDAKDAFDDFVAETDHAMWEILSDYGKQRRHWLAVGSLAGFCSRLLELVPPVLLAIAIDSLFFDEEPFALPGVPDHLLPADPTWQFALLVGLVGAIYLAESILHWVNGYAWNNFAIHIQHQVRVDTYEAMQAMEMEFFDNKQTGEVMSILNNDVNQLEGFLRRNVNTAIRIIVMVFGTGAIMLALNWQLALVALIPIPLLALTSYVFVRVIKPKYVDVRSKVGQLNARLENNISGIAVVKSFTSEDYEFERVAESSRDHLEANWNAIKTRIKFHPSLQLITGFGYLITFLIGGYWVMFGAFGPFTLPLTAGVLVAFLMYTQRFMWPMRQFGEIVDDYQYAEAASQRILGLMDHADAVDESDHIPDLDHVSGHVAFKNVDFSYRFGGEIEREMVLRNIDFAIEPGEYVGIAGPTGAGKTTLVKLLMRFYDVDSGEITIDGRDIREVSVESLRQSIGYVSQDPFLFHGTIGENIAYSDPDVADTEIISAARRAGAWDFIERLPDGLDTMVGERGIKLSGGQRQRVSLARAVLKDPAILILDEATSHVDNETEVLIQDSLQELIRDRTTFAIAHRLSTVRNADTILVLDEGKLAEQGSHEALLERDGLYANLWRVQVGEIDALPETFIERTRRRRAELDSSG